MNCYCQRDYETVANFYGTLLDVMTEHYAVFRKKYNVNIPFLSIERTDEKLVRRPRDFEDNLKEKMIEFQKECIALVDAGYYNAAFTEEHQERFRKEIAEYQSARNEVWE